MPFLNFLKEGVTPSRLALSIVLGVAFGVFPIVGVSTTLCIVFALLFRLNTPAMQTANYLVYPLQIILLVPFIKIGLWIFGGGVQGQEISISVFEQIFDRGLWVALELLWQLLLQAVVAWVMLLLPVGLLLYGILLAVFKKVLRKKT